MTCALSLHYMSRRSGADWCVVAMLAPLAPLTADEPPPLSFWGTQGQHTYCPCCQLVDLFWSGCHVLSLVSSSTTSQSNAYLTLGGSRMLVEHCWLSDQTDNARVSHDLI